MCPFSKDDGDLNKKKSFSNDLIVKRYVNQLNILILH